jgi:heme exporter protein A
VSAAVLPERVATALTLEVRDLGHDYGGRRGLAPLSFTLTSPSIVAVTGANGSGKSTLLRILAGLLRPARGRWILAQDGTVTAASARLGAVGYAGPDLAFYEEFTALENLAFAAEAMGMSAPAEAARAALERTDMTALGDDRVAALSSGMKQRLRLGFALLRRPPVLLLDEPGSHLDEEGRGLVARLVDDQRARGIAIIATNDEREWRLAGQRIELRSGGLGHPA